MATTTYNTSALPLGAITLHRVASVATQIVDQYHAWQSNRRTVRALSALSARQLDDIGLTRGDVEFLARNGRF